MYKSKFKILLPIFLVVLLVSSYCLATSNQAPTQDEAPVATESAEKTDEANTTTPDGEIATTGEQQPIMQDWISGDLYKIDSSFNMQNVVDGNAFIIGKDVTISGEIGGDLFIIADKLTIDGGYVYSSVFALANEITIKGTIYDLYASCNTFNLDEGGFIYRDMKLAANNVNISGRVRRNAYISTNNLNLLKNDAELISGNLEYNSSKEFNIPDGSVAGTVKFSKDTSNEEKSNKTALSYLSSLATALLFTFVVMLVLLWLAPKFIEKLGNASIIKSLLLGLITPVILFVLSFILLFSVIGLPVVGCIVLVCTLLALVGKSITSIYVAKIVTKKFKKESKPMVVLFALLVTAFLWFVKLIPFVGFIISILASVLGIGLTVLNIVSKKTVVE